MGMVSGVELTKTRATIYLDGVAFLKMKRRDFDEMPVEEGDDLDEEEYLNRLCARQAKPAYEAALNLLTARDMTAHDLQAALKRRGYLQPVAESVCERLIENRLIDDSRYAQRYVELHQGSELGLYALKRKLRARGVGEEAASEALEQIDDESQMAAAVSLARKLARRYAGEDPYKARSKLSQALARRGFSWDIVREAVEQSGLDESEATL